MGHRNMYYKDIYFAKSRAQALQYFRNWVKNYRKWKTKCRVVNIKRKLVKTRRGGPRRYVYRVAFVKTRKK